MLRVCVAAELGWPSWLQMGTHGLSSEVLLTSEVGWGMDGARSYRASSTPWITLPRVTGIMFAPLAVPCRTWWWWVNPLWWEGSSGTRMSGWSRDWRIRSLMRPMASMMRTVSATPQLWATTARGTAKLPPARRARATTPAPSQPHRLQYSLCIDRERAIPNACFCSEWHSGGSKASLPATVFCSEEASLARWCSSTCEIVISRIL